MHHRTGRNLIKTNMLCKLSDTLSVDRCRDKEPREGPLFVESDGELVYYDVLLIGSSGQSCQTNFYDHFKQRSR
jgi:hypothetical protein